MIGRVGWQSERDCKISGANYHPGRVRSCRTLLTERSRLHEHGKTMDDTLAEGAGKHLGSGRTWESRKAARGERRREQQFYRYVFSHLSCQTYASWPFLNITDSSDEDTMARSGRCLPMVLNTATFATRMPDKSINLSHVLTRFSQLSASWVL